MRKAVLIALLFFMGCSPFELARLMGTGTRPFREQGKVYSKVFYKNSLDAYNKTVEILKDLGAHFQRGEQSKGFFIVDHLDSSYRFCASSTEVAVFFKETGENKTQIEVASLNHSLAEYASEQVFNGLEGKPLYRLEKIITEEDKQD